MIKNTYPGKFIVFEGLDGSGQSTQAELLVKFLSSPEQKRLLKHKGVHITKEPTPGLIGGLIRAQLTHVWKSSPEALQLLFSADRLYHLEKEIIPLLKKGVIVISDRYFFSTVAYGETDVRNKQWLLSINEYALVPDLVVLLKVSPHVCVRRIHKSRHGIELFEKEKILEKVWETYAWLSKKFSYTRMVDGEQSVEQVTKTIQDTVMKRFL